MSIKPTYTAEPTRLGVLVVEIVRGSHGHPLQLSLSSLATSCSSASFTISAAANDAMSSFASWASPPPSACPPRLDRLERRGAGEQFVGQVRLMLVIDLVMRILHVLGGRQHLGLVSPHPPEPAALMLDLVRDDLRVRWPDVLALSYAYLHVRLELCAQ